MIFLKRFLVLLAIVYFLSIFFLSKLDSIGQKKLAEIASDNVALENFDYTQWDQKQRPATKVYRIEGQKVFFKNKTLGIFEFPLAKDIAIKDVRVVFFDKDQIKSQLQSGLALISGNENQLQEMLSSSKIDFINHATLANTKGNFLSCDQLLWDRESDKFQGHGNCYLRMESKTIHAENILTNSYFTKLEIT